MAQRPRLPLATSAPAVRWDAHETTARRGAGVARAVPTHDTTSGVTDTDTIFSLGAKNRRRRAIFFNLSSLFIEFQMKRNLSSVLLMGRLLRAD
jgi:hypothetical protein